MRRGDAEVFRDVIGHFASGVAVITARHDGRDFGTTASAVASLSLEPPMLLICLKQDSETHGAIVSSGRFVVNVLAEGQESIARRFAVKAADKFEGSEPRRGKGEVPIIGEALAHIDCVVETTASGGTHTVFLAHAEDAIRHPGAPLAYYRGRFVRLAEGDLSTVE